MRAVSSRMAAEFCSTASIVSRFCDSIFSRMTCHSGADGDFLLALDASRDRCLREELSTKAHRLFAQLSRASRKRAASAQPV